MSDLILFTDSWLLSDLPFHPNLVARWNLNESVGETATDSVSSYIGQLYGDPEWMPSEGYWQGALLFDGTDDSVEVTGYSGITGSQSRTVCAWIRFDQNILTGSYSILSWGNDSTVGSRWRMLATDQTIMSTGVIRISVLGGYIEGGSNLYDGQWHHVAAVLADDGSPDINEITLYVDGQEERYYKPVTVPLVINTSSAGTVKFGTYTSDHFKGLIDDIRIYNEALTAEEILNIYRIGSVLQHSPDLTVDNRIDNEDWASVSQQWQTEEPAVVITEFLASNDSENPPVIEEGQIRDGNGDASDWIEIYNQTDFPIDLADWGLTDDVTDLLQWQFPQNTILQGQEYLLVFASNKDLGDHPGNYPYVDPAGYLHTNFKLSASGEYLALTRPDSTVENAYDSVENPDSGEYGFPEQEENISYGIFSEQESYFAYPTPQTGNRESLLGFVDAPDFSHERGFYTNSFQLTLTTETPDAVIRYTTNGTEPSLSSGTTYTAPINATAPSDGSTGFSIRAAAFKPGYQTSKIKTKTYIFNPTSAMNGLPAICVSGSPTETFYNPDGIMAIVGGAWVSGVWQPNGPDDYNNVLGRGMAYERPASMEYFNAALGLSFQEDCGIRVHGSAWMRPRFTPAQPIGTWSGSGKYGFRLYFRGEYGDTFFRHAVLEKFPEIDKIDTIVLRAGHNDRVNPFIRDEMIRRLQHFMGNAASLGTFMNLYINGDYKGYYNFCERIDEDYCQQYFNSDYEWDVVGWVVPGSFLEARDGNMTAFKDFINYANTNDLTDPVHYQEVTRQLDLEGFVDYIMVQCWGGNWDWPQNNWSATAERSPNRKWRFFVWDAEGAMDGNLTRNRFNNLNSDGSDLSKLYRALQVNEDFQMLFADRIQKHFLEPDGVMRQESLNSLFWELEAEVDGVIPNIDTYIPVTYIPGRESIFVGQCTSEDLFTFQGPRILLDGQDAKKINAEFENIELSFQDNSGQNGDVYFTLDGTDPRIPVSQRDTNVTLISENADKRVLIPTGNIGTNWRSQVSYDDSSWNAGLPSDPSKTGGVGYERDTVGNKAYISYDVHDEMYNQRTSAYIRIPFTVNPAELPTWDFLTFSIRYDDGFVAYINGTEVCRREFNGPPAWNSKASSLHENNNIEVINLDTYLNTLQPGDNLLAIHGLNISTTSSDFLISAMLKTGHSSSGIGIAPTAQMYTSPVALQKSAHVRTRTLSGSTWSALRQMDVSIGRLNEDLRISELMYNPGGDPNEEFIELTNIGAEDLNLYFTNFTDGIDYTFGDTVLVPGEFLLVVKNQTVFENRYGTGLPVAGEFEGSLDNSGEKIKLRDATGCKIQTADYKDGWYDITDGDGFSLTVIDPMREKTAIPVENLEAHWALNENNGTVIQDTVGTHHGTIMNMQDTERVLGRIDKALDFDGIDDYIVVTGYTGITGTQSRTICAWLKMPNDLNAGAVHTIISYGDSDSIPSGSRWSLWIQEDGYPILIASDANAYVLTDIADNSWHHIAIILTDEASPAVGDILFYIDGQPAAVTYSNPMQTIDTTGEEFVHIGATSSDGNTTINHFFDGMLDDIRFYNRALDPGEIDILAQNFLRQKEYWRPSAIQGGAPGRNETPGEQLPLPGAIVINEILSHSHAASLDWIELVNTTGMDIPIGGWFLSDSFISESDRKKYQIPAGVVLTPANPYYIIEEDKFNNLPDPGCRIPFALSEGGETLYLQSADGEELTGYFTKEEFGAAQTNVSLGRFQKSTGTWNFVPMSSQSKGTTNAYPKVGPIIMTEIMYNPSPDENDQIYEYIELMNISGQTVRTAEFVSTYSSPTIYIEEWIPWKFTDGITFEFPVNMEFAPNERILLVKNLQAFNGRYSGVPGGTVILEWTGGNLDNGGEKLQLSMSGDKEYQQDRYYIREDRVNYSDEGDWPTLADGTGKSLTHSNPTSANNNYTNDPIHWTASDPTPGW